MNNQPHETSTSNNRGQTEPVLTTFGDHLQELKGRLFWVAISFVVFSAMAYPKFQLIVDLLKKPLGEQKLYYLTPAGGFSFMIKICMYVGMVGMLPVVIYHLYKFIAPVMRKNRARNLLSYTVVSIVLAVLGMVFAYSVSLPAAMKFLTGFSVGKIDAMLTIDAYLSFVFAYLIAGAVLFQLPLIMLIVNSITPLKPKALMNYQRHIIVGSFVAAAILSPTPDVVNQTLLAAPMIVMYQLGILVIWLKQHTKKRREKTSLETMQHHDAQRAMLLSAHAPGHGARAVSTSGLALPAGLTYADDPASFRARPKAKRKIPAHSRAAGQTQVARRAGAAARSHQEPVKHFASQAFAAQASYADATVPGQMSAGYHSPMSYDMLPTKNGAGSFALGDPSAAYRAEEPSYQPTSTSSTVDGFLLRATG